MREYRCDWVAAAFLAAAILGGFARVGVGADWPQFRGFPGTGCPELAPPPSSWSERRNVAWRAELPGRGVSSPIVVAGRVVVTACTGANQERLHVLCFAADSGKLLWQRQFWATGSTSTHPKTCVAAPTPATDGRRIFALFSSNDLACLDLEGRLLWFRGLTWDYPQAWISLGMASSPVVSDDTVVVQVQADTDAFAMGLDAATGRTRWKLARPHSVNWSSPIVWRRGPGSKPLVVLQGSRDVLVVRPRSGTLVGRYAAEAATIPSSTGIGPLLLVPSGGLTALKLPASGSELLQLWRRASLRPSMASPLAHRGRLYVVSGSVLKCADPQSGRVLWRLRLRGPISSSPVAAGQLLFVFNEDGVGYVVQLGDRGKLVASNPMGQTILATPALSDGAMFVRSDRWLWKIGQRRCGRGLSSTAATGKSGVLPSEGKGAPPRRRSVAIDKLCADQ